MTLGGWQPDPPIRLAGNHDVALVHALMREFYAKSGYFLDDEAASRALTELIGNPGVGRVWLISHLGHVVGYIAVTFGFSLEFYGRDAFIDDLFIQPRFRGVGLGTRVLDTVELECRALGIRALHLEVGRSNQAGQALYRKRGFRDNDRLLLSKRLATPPRPV